MNAQLDRLRRGVRRYGPAGAVKHAAGLLRNGVHSQQRNVWYQLPLRQPRPRRELDGSFELVQAQESQLDLLEELWSVQREEAVRRLGSGGTLWFVLDGQAPVFSCWTFRGRTPVRAAPGGWLALPDDTACLEESMTSAQYRGRGVAPAAWTAIVDRLDADDGLRRLVTSVGEDNAASRRAVEKIGFAEFGGMETTRIAGRVRIEPSGDGPDAAFLAGLRR